MKKLILAVVIAASFVACNDASTTATVKTDSPVVAPKVDSPVVTPKVDSPVVAPKTDTTKKVEVKK
jgi:hypothetical protein